jgi:pimeloyl-ACP methyl ester carboxylesterase
MEAVRVEFEGGHGINLVADAWGDPKNPPVILAHGGGQTRHSWGGTARILAEQGWYAVAYDHRGHGESGWSEDSLYELIHFAGDMACLARTFSRPPAVVGASLGGLAAMLGAGEIESDMFSAIVLVDVTPQLNRAGVEKIFQFMSANMYSGFASLEEVADAIASYTGRPRKTDLSGLKKNLRERDGRYYWHWDPNFFSPREDGPAHPQQVMEAAAQIKQPVLLVRGQASDVVTQAEVDEFLKLIPHAEYIDVEKARHMVAGDRNDIFSESVVNFLKGILPQVE